MGRLSNIKKKKKEAAARSHEVRKLQKINIIPENENVSKEMVLKTKLKRGRKSIQRVQINGTTTRKMSAVEEEKQKVKEENRKATENARQKLAENRQNEEESRSKRREVVDKVHLKIKLRRAEKEKNDLKKALESATVAKFSTKQPLLDLSNCQQTSQRAPTSPPTPKITVNSSTRLKNIVGLSNGKYDKLRDQLAMEGVTLPSTSTIKRNENRIYDNHFKNSTEPDFYGLIEKAVMKYDFSHMDNVRITIGGDGGCYFLNFFHIDRCIFKEGMLKNLVLKLFRFLTTSNYRYRLRIYLLFGYMLVKKNGIC
jgi:hypothetical protein